MRNRERLREPAGEILGTRGEDAERSAVLVLGRICLIDAVPARRLKIVLMRRLMVVRAMGQIAVFITHLMLDQREVIRRCQIRKHEQANESTDECISAALASLAWRAESSIRENEHGRHSNPRRGGTQHNAA